MLRTQIYLPESQVRALRKVAAKDNTSVSEVIRKAVDQQVIKKGKPSNMRFKNAGESLGFLAKEAERLKFKGPKDLATNMDKYLYDKDFR